MEEIIKLPCLECGKMWEFKETDVTIREGLNVFCIDNEGECEDKYAFKQ